MSRDDRQDINKLHKSGSDLPPRDKNVKEPKAEDTREIVNPRPKGYTGQHRRDSK